MVPEETKPVVVECAVHKLVAQTFIPNPENKQFIIHLDGNTSNNKTTNLKWATEQEYKVHNKYMALKHGRNPNNPLTYSYVDLEREQ